MLQKCLFTLLSCIGLHAANAQTVKAPVQTATPAAAPVFNYKKSASGIPYAFIVDKPTSPKPEEGGTISLRMQSICNNRILYSTAQAFNGKPGVYGVAKPAYKGDLVEVIMLMTPGDSLVCLVDADALFTNAKSKRPDFIKPGDKVQYFIKLVSVKSKATVLKEQQEAMQKQFNEQMARQKIAAAKQASKDEKLLKAYFAKNQLTPTRTASGLYYSIQEPGNGELAVVGDSITMNYTGTLLDGTKFDSNEDTAFQHVQPYNFVLGRGMVIKGWDEGVALLRQGAKATLFIPSGLAYGTQSRPGSAANKKGIPANSILVFDVTMVKATHPSPAAAETKPSNAAEQQVPATPVQATEAPVKPQEAATEKTSAPTEPAKQPQ